MGLFLIAAGADLNVDAEFPLKRSGLPGGTALKQAFAHSPEMAQALIDAGADLNGQDRYGHTLLTDAALHGNIERIELLINAGADVNAAGRGGYTALMAAAAEHHLFAAEPRLDIVELLLQAGADVNAINDNCRTALDQALERPRGAEETASLLRQHGATTGYQLSTACVIQ
jgi:ankyrin repeat protein